MFRRNVLVCAAALSLAVISSASAQSVNASKRVQQALGTLNRVVDHTGRLISAKNYAFLPAENNEFKEGTAALRGVLGRQPAKLRTTVGPMLKKAAAESQSMADAAASHDDAKLASTHAALAASVNEILGAFPANVRPGQPSVAREQEEDRVRETTGSAH